MWSCTTTASVCSFFVGAAQIVNGIPIIEYSQPGTSRCIQRFCPRGFNITVLPPGQLDDVPGYAACVRMGIYGVSNDLNASVDFMDPAVNAEET